MATARTAFPTRFPASLAMVFDGRRTPGTPRRPIEAAISGIALDGQTIFCCSDESPTIERLVFDPATGEARRHASIPLASLFGLPFGDKAEFDMEGLAAADGFLWICGSHGLKRKKPGNGRSGIGQSGIGKPKWDVNRGFLGRIEVAAVDAVAAAIERGAPPEGPGPVASARMLPIAKSPKTVLRRLLADDPVIGPFLDLPAKENGLDIEGLAVGGTDVLLGLRGPVVGGLALIVALRVREEGDHGLKLARFADGRRHRLQALDLGGQGIRDLVFRDGRLVVLSGATMSLDCLQSVFAIENYSSDRKAYDAAELSRIIPDLPVVGGFDHAEALDIMGTGGTQRLLVAYDRPSPSRIDPDTHRLTADLFDIAP